MALYFNSETFGILCFPVINYNWLFNGYRGLPRLIRSDVPFSNSSCICPYDLIGNGENGSFVEILHGVADGSGGFMDIGIIKVSDSKYGIYNVPTNTQPSGAGTEFSFTVLPTFDGILASEKCNLYFGVTYYDDNQSNPAQFVAFDDYSTQIYRFEFTGMDVVPPDPVYSYSLQGAGFVSCTVTDEQMSFLHLPNILPKAQDFDCSNVSNPAHLISFLNSDATTANGGANSGVPINYYGNYSSATYGNGNFNDYSDSRGNAEPAKDTLLSSGLIDIYHPDSGDLRALAAYLHSSEFMDVITKMWDNPNESIISLSLFPIAPISETDSNLILGGVDTEIATKKLVDTHVIKVSFGTIDFSVYGEKYGSFLDYDYTSAVIFLPCIGAHELRIKDIQNTKIKLDYTIDFLNGDITAQIETTDSIVRTLETLHGNCSVQIPLTSSNYANIFQSLISGIGDIASGNVLGVASDIMNANVSHSNIGGIGSTAGVHGRLDAFILLNRPSQVLPNHYNEIHGRPLETGGVVSEYHGLTIGKIECQIATATESEKAEIESLFEGGVYLV